MQASPAINLDQEFGLNPDFTLLEDPNFGNAEDEWTNDEQTEFFDYGHAPIQSVHPGQEAVFQPNAHHPFGMQMSPVGSMTMEMSPQLGTY